MPYGHIAAVCGVMLLACDIRYMRVEGDEVSQNQNNLVHLQPLKKAIRIIIGDPDYRIGISC